MSTLKLSTLSNLAGSQSTAVENAINGSAKAWVNFNGTGTVAIRRAYNVSSITDVNTGRYIVNFTNEFSDIDYAVVGTVSGTSGVYNMIVLDAFVAKTTTSVAVGSYNTSWAAADSAILSVTIFR